jgi:2-succinyl-6-hydroxy-2,4-cyclohexadiene-1-carboxylate synthase
MTLLRVTSQGTGEPVVWLHGFTQTRYSAPEFLASLSHCNRVLTLDLPGHGEAAGVRADLVTTARLIAEAVEEERFSLAGYSFGGRVALHVALAIPYRIRRLVLVSATRGLADPLERAARVSRDEALADHIVAVGTDIFLDEWLAQPLFSGAAELDRERRSIHAEGLAASLRLAGTGTQEFLGPRLGELTMPVLTLAGRRDEKFLAEARAISAGVLEGRVEIIEGAGHALHLEQPGESAELVSRFLSE